MTSSLKTTRPRALIFGMMHRLVDLYQVHIMARWGPNGPAVGGRVQKLKYTEKSFSPKLLGFGM